MINEKDETKGNTTGIKYDPISNSYILIPDELQELYDEYDKLQKTIDEVLDYSKEQIRVLSLYK